MLKLIIDKIEDVDEAYRGLYEPKDGKWHLKVEGVEDAARLRADLRRANNESADRRKQIEKWEKVGKTPEEIEELLAKLAKDDEDKLNAKGEWDKLKAQMVEKHEVALKAKDALIAAEQSKVTAMRSSLESHLVDAQATSAIASAKGVPTLLLPHVRKHVKVVEENGEYTVKVVDDKGDPRVNGKGEPLTVAEMVTEMRGNEIFGRAFDGSGASGGGSNPGGGNGGAIPQNTKRSSFKNEKERAGFIDEHGLAAYQALPA